MIELTINKVRYGLSLWRLPQLNTVPFQARCSKDSKDENLLARWVFLLTCYFRHLTLLFEQIGVDVTSENKQEIDKKIHKLVNVPYKNCSAAWKAIKSRMAEDEERFLADLDKALA
ncbi:MAG: hypothetical protein ACFFDV_06525 [Candidatus Thorarchaeota archaeon]